jgi:hypothetical protein
MIVNNTPPHPVEAKPDVAIFWPMTITLSLLTIALMNVFSFIVFAPTDIETWNVDRSFVIPPFITPTELDSRGPCPFLNTLANHGILPHNGQFITREILDGALIKMHVDDWTRKVLLDAGWVVAHRSDENPQSYHFDLGDLGRHADSVWEGLEHDVSLTRNDFGSGMDYIHANQSLVQQLLSFENKQVKTITIHSVAKARNLRLRQAREEGTASYGPMTQLLGDLECAAFVDIIGRGGQVETHVAESVLGQEKFPDGWGPPLEETVFGRMVYSTLRCFAFRWLTDNWA